jgi:nitrogen regulatory protein P-II 1
MNSPIFKIEALVRPNRVEAVQEALHDIELDSLTVTESRGSGRRQAVTHTFRGSQYGRNLTPITKIELFVVSDKLEEAIEAIRDAAETGEVGDGKLFVFPVSDAMRIRTGERGIAALE